jgi:hypothetical protein
MQRPSFQNTRLENQMPPKSESLFVCGTLLSRRVMMGLLERVPSSRSAVLSGYRASKIGSRVYLLKTAGSKVLTSHQSKYTRSEASQNSTSRSCACEHVVHRSPCVCVCVIFDTRATSFLCANFPGFRFVASSISASAFFHPCHFYTCIAFCARPLTHVQKMFQEVGR